MGKLGNEKQNTPELDSGAEKIEVQPLNAMPSEIRDELTYMLRIGNLCAPYYNEIVAMPTEQDFAQWLASLPESIAGELASAGYDSCKDLIALRLHTADRKEAALDAYLKSRLSAQDYLRWSTTRARSN